MEQIHVQQMLDVLEKKLHASEFKENLKDEGFRAISVYLVSLGYVLHESNGKLLFSIPEWTKARIDKLEEEIKKIENSRITQHAELEKKLEAKTDQLAQKLKEEADVLGKTLQAKKEELEKKFRIVVVLVVTLSVALLAILLYKFTDLKTNKLILNFASLLLIVAGICATYMVGFQLKSVDDFTVSSGKNKTQKFVVVVAALMIVIGSFMLSFDLFLK